jgi:hypothetical protein
MAQAFVLSSLLTKIRRDMQGLCPADNAAVLEAPSPAPNCCTSGVLMPNSTAASRASRPRAGQAGCAERWTGSPLT